ncbi:MAG: undecaprenyldiphospho-muramoylpentapeptide beta-N-acetylglucosaminyltransferase [Clostridia bacterium]|nr:undecaprenyldiphospho-muramoylpentapeptide beta-N-acetylglucosaminyltransferase [Clostridia bacterium]
MRVILAGGGTGGHINPAISIADYAKAHNDNFEALFIGTQRGLEHKLVPKAGYNIKYIDIAGFNRKNLLKNVSVMKKLIKARKDCRRIIREFKPDCVVCTGGYVSGPVIMAAAKEGIPSLIHEQNVYPGLTVKGSEKYVKYLAVSFDETVKLMKEKDKCVVTGNPIRTEIINANKESAREKLGINKPFVLAFGGSLGAQRINDTVVSIIPKLKDNGGIKLLFGTGERNYENVKNAAYANGLTDEDKDIEIIPYIDNMAEVMAAADIVIARSGAITVSELAAMGKPSILIPSPNVVRNHQEQNAREFEKAGAAAVITEDELTSERLYNEIIRMLGDDNCLKNMSNNLKAIAKTDALEKIYELMIDMSR